MKPLVLLTALLILAVPSFAQTPERRGEIGADAPAGKAYIYKHSAGKPRQMEARADDVRLLPCIALLTP